MLLSSRCCSRALDRRRIEERARRCSRPALPVIAGRRLASGREDRARAIDREQRLARPASRELRELLEQQHAPLRSQRGQALFDRRRDRRGEAQRVRMAHLAKTGNVDDDGEELSSRRVAHRRRRAVPGVPPAQQKCSAPTTCTAPPNASAVPGPLVPTRSSLQSAPGRKFSSDKPSRARGSPFAQEHPSAAVEEREDVSAFEVIAALSGERVLARPKNQSRSFRRRKKKLLFAPDQRRRFQLGQDSRGQRARPGIEDDRPHFSARRFTGEQRAQRLLDTALRRPIEGQLQLRARCRFLGCSRSRSACP